MHRFILPSLLLIAAVSTSASAGENLFPDIRIAADIQIDKDVKIRIRTLVEQTRKKDAKLKDQALTELENYGRLAVPVLKELKASDAALFDGGSNLVEDIDVEVWEGYYYYSTGNFENAIRNRVERVHFRFLIKRNADGTFSGTGSERARYLGVSEVKGSVNRHKGTILFDKQYVEKASHNWVYKGTWNPHTQRMEGYYGERQGGFVLYPRPLSREERDAFE